MGGLQNTNWDYLYNATSGVVSSAPGNLSDNINNKLSCYHEDNTFRYKDVVSSSTSVVLGVVYLAIISLILILLYYLCRPQTAVQGLEEDRHSAEGAGAAAAAAEGKGRGAGKRGDEQHMHFWLDPNRRDHTFHALKHEAVDSTDHKLEYDFAGKSPSERSAVLRKMRRDWEEPLALIPAEISLYRFREWWGRGGKLLLWAVHVFTIICVVLTLAMANYFYQFFILPSPLSNSFDFCARLPLRHANFSLYFSVQLVFVLICFFVAV